jgi:hypothetical protein
LANKPPFRTEPFQIVELVVRLRDLAGLPGAIPYDRLDPRYDTRSEIQALDVISALAEEPEAILRDRGVPEREWTNCWIPQGRRVIEVVEVAASQLLLELYGLRDGLHDSQTAHTQEYLTKSLHNVERALSDFVITRDSSEVEQHQKHSGSKGGHARATGLRERIQERNCKIVERAREIRRSHTEWEVAGILSREEQLSQSQIRRILNPTKKTRTK